MSDDLRNARRVARLLRMLAGKIEEDPEFIKGIDIEDISVLSRKKKTEQSIDFDISKIYSEEGELALRQRLEQLDLKELKSIVRKHSFDSSRLAEKWKDKDRLIKLILERVSARNEKGQAFLKYP
ncbi:hypothetical protein MUP01_12920 [Candidatus Bathyarchaeota archaeon]|nr:hypothetical protein [Candidatus Bathyarchaeota archaeon]